MKRFTMICLACGLVLSLLPALSLQISQAANQKKDPGAAVNGEAGAKLDEYLTRLARFGFSGSVLVAKEGKVLMHKGYGLADQKQKIPNTTETVFDIASLTKQFTAAAILKLEVMGKLKTGDKISKHLPDVPQDKAPARRDGRGRHRIRGRDRSRAAARLCRAQASSCRPGADRAARQPAFRSAVQRVRRQHAALSSL